MKFGQLKRRELITLLGGAVAAWPVASRAQPTKSPARIGFLPLGSPSSAYDRFLVEAFRQGLRQAGLIENRDITLDIVWITKDADQAVTELLQRGADILVPCGTSASLAARRHSLTIPIVFINVGNPIAVGLVENLARPGGNATGFSDLLADLSRKHVDLAREVANRRALLITFGTPGGPTAETGLPSPRRRPNPLVFNFDRIPSPTSPKWTICLQRWREMPRRRLLFSPAHILSNIAIG